jgi:hypothetical protein
MDGGGTSPAAGSETGAAGGFEAVPETRARRAAPASLGGGYGLARWNAVRHGLLARETVLPWEDRAEYERLLAALDAEHRPEGPTECHLLEELAGVVWRKRRLRLAEGAAAGQGLGGFARSLREEADDARDGAAAARELEAALAATPEDTRRDLAALARDRAAGARALDLLRTPGAGALEDALEAALAALDPATRDRWERRRLGHDDEPRTAREKLAAKIALLASRMQPAPASAAASGAAPAGASAAESDAEPGAESGAAPASDWMPDWEEDSEADWEAESEAESGAASGSGAAPTPADEARARARFLETEAADGYRRREAALRGRGALRARALGQAHDPARLAGLARYETHLDRKLERTLALLHRLRELRSLPSPPEAP